MEKQSFISRKNHIAVWGLLAAMLVIGTVWDLPISAKLFNINDVVAVFFAGFGAFPGSVLLGVVGFSILKLNPKGSKTRWLAWIGFVVTQFIAVYFVYGMSIEYWPRMPEFVKVLISIVVLAAADVPMYYIVRDADDSKLKRYIFYLLFVWLVSNLAAQEIKGFWGRPRYRWLAEAGVQNYRPWFVMDKSVKEQAVAAGVASQEFKSFPSGHVQTAAMVVALSTIGYINPKYADKGGVILWYGIGYSVFLALTRIAMGAHFLTDTAAGILLAWVPFILGNAVFKIKKEVTADAV